MSYQAAPARRQNPNSMLCIIMGIAHVCMVAWSIVPLYGIIQDWTYYGHGLNPKFGWPLFWFLILSTFVSIFIVIDELLAMREDRRAHQLWLEGKL